MTAPGCILIVEDEFLIADHLAAMVDDMGLAVCGIADTADGAIAMAVEHRPGAVLMDVRLKGRKDGIDAAQSIHGSVGCPIIFVTGSRESSTVARINEDHPAAILFKPVKFEQLETVVLAALGGGPGPAPVTP